MKKVLLALDIQAGLSTPGMIVDTVNRMASKLPTIATVLVANPDEERNLEYLDWKAPNEDSSLVKTKYVYPRHGYQIPTIILKTLKKNGIEEVLIAGAHTEGFLLAAGFHLFDAGFKVSMIAPLCLTGQYHQHTVTMKIWENSIGSVYETTAEAGVSA